MGQNLFPVFDMPLTLTEDVKNEKQYGIALRWNFEEGDFEMNLMGQPLYGNGYEAWVQWCKKALLTQRWAHYAYGSNAGIEAVEAFKEPDRKVIENSLERTIAETLLADPMGRTRQVRNFQFHWNSDEVQVICEVLGSDGSSAEIDAALKL